MNSLIEEYECILQAQQEPKHFEALYDKYFVSVWKFIGRRVEDKQDVADLVSDVFASALFHIKKFKPMGYPFSSWLYKIASNEVNRYYRASKKIRLVSIDHASCKSLAAQTNMEWNDLKQVLGKALHYLSAQEIELIELRYFESKSFAEIGFILQVTENNAKVKTYRAIDKLKQKFSVLQ